MEDITEAIITNTIEVEPSQVVEEKETTAPAEVLRYDETEPDCYRPSIVHLTDFTEISEILKLGVSLEEDEPNGPLVLDPELVEKVRENPQVQRILQRMRPEQITPEVVRRLLGRVTSS